MQKIAKKIEIVRSSIKSLSSMSQESCDSLYEVLSENYAYVGVTVVNEYSDLAKIQFLQPDLVILGMEYVPADRKFAGSQQKTWLGDYLDERGIAYTGSSKAAHQLGRDKSLAKQRMVESNVNTARFTVIQQAQNICSEDIQLSYPLFVKPANGGGGYGIDSKSLVHDFEQLRTKIDYISSQLGYDSLVEEYLPGREFSVAILRNSNSGYYEAMPIELVAPADEYGTRILSSSVKSSNLEGVVALGDSSLRTAVCNLALDAFHALDARDYGRIDIRMNSEHTPYFLEANLIPSLISGYGSFPKACMMNASLDYESMILEIVALGFTRALDSNDNVTDIVTHKHPAHPVLA